MKTYHRWRWIHWKKLGFSCFQWWNASFFWHPLYHLWSLQRLSTQKRTHWQVPGILWLENTEDSGDYAGIHTRATRLADVGSGKRTARSWKCSLGKGILIFEVTYMVSLSLLIHCAWTFPSEDLDPKDQVWRISRPTTNSEPFGYPSWPKQLISNISKTELAQLNSLQLRVFSSWSSTLSDIRTSFHCSKGFGTSVCFKIPKSQGLVFFFPGFFPGHCSNWNSSKVWAELHLLHLHPCGSSGRPTAWSLGCRSWFGFKLFWGGIFMENWKAYFHDANR